MFYLTKTPVWVIKLFNHSIWNIPGSEKTIYLSFDDGPHPVITPFVLDELKKYNAQATFFCIGKNVVENPTVYSRILAGGHAVGNHTFNHVNGWKTKSDVYIDDVARASTVIKSKLFRPPYGKITRKQHKLLRSASHQFKIIMWTILSGDFDVKLSPEKCCRKVIESAKSGAVIVFHDSEKAYESLRYTLPKVLKHFADKGYTFKKITG